uniref:FMRFamide-like neuropeptides 14 n=1 Tax=Heterorhabditis bacteriophora TaxID=37862 RepID=A0A1I7WCW9_HETBA
MLHYVMLFVFFALSIIVCTFAGNEEILSEEFCRQFPSLHLCRLHDTLQGSLIELQYLLQDTNVESAIAVTSAPLDKRKSAFVRFGKRSADDIVDMEKRKSAFVRFGRSVADIPDKRKSQYIRFGKK